MKEIKKERKMDIVWDVKKRANYKQKKTRNFWSQEEDDLVKYFILRQKRKVDLLRIDYRKIEYQMKRAGYNRDNKGIRHRYNNVLKQQFNVEPLTKEEIDIVIDEFAKFGGSYVKIAKKLTNRSENFVKKFICWNRKNPVFIQAVIRSQQHLNKNKNGTDIDICWEETAPAKLLSIPKVKSKPSQIFLKHKYKK